MKNKRSFLRLFCCLIVFSSAGMSLDVLDKEIKADYQKFRSHHKSTEKLRVSVQYLDRLMKPQWIAAILGSGCGVGFSAKKRQATPEEAVIMHERLAYAADKLGYDPKSYFSNAAAHADQDICRHQSVVWAVMSAATIEKSLASIPAAALKKDYGVYGNGYDIASILKSYSKSREYLPLKVKGYLDSIRRIFEKAIKGETFPHTVNGYSVKSGGTLLIKYYAQDDPDGHGAGFYVFAGFENSFNQYVLPAGAVDSGRGDVDIYAACERETYEETSRSVVIRNTRILPAIYSSLTNKIFVVYQDNNLSCKKINEACATAAADTKEDGAFKEVSNYVVISLDQIIAKAKALRDKEKREPTKNFPTIDLTTRTGDTVKFSRHYFDTFTDDLENLIRIREKLKVG